MKKNIALVIMITIGVFVGLIGYERYVSFRAANSTNHGNVALETNKTPEQSTAKQQAEPLQSGGDKFGTYVAKAEQGSATHQFSVAMSYYIGRKGVPQNYSESAKWFRLSAEQGHRLGQQYMGIMYQLGHGVEKNYAYRASRPRQQGSTGTGWKHY